MRVRAWVARGIRVPARNALLADVVPGEAYGRAYGFERAMDKLGAIGLTPTRSLGGPQRDVWRACGLLAGEL